VHAATRDGDADIVVTEHLLRADEARPPDKDITRPTMIETRPQNADAPHLTVEERRPDSFPAYVLAPGLCACAGFGALLALLIVMVT
jgi:hypothetical protein